jgi:DNA-directed RNA polymerase subunit RPC12/RpoP
MSAVERLTNWWCSVCGWRWYVRPDKQSSSAHTRCPACGSRETERDL